MTVVAINSDQQHTYATLCRHVFFGRRFWSSLASLARSCASVLSQYWRTFSFAYVAHTRSQGKSQSCSTAQPSFSQRVFSSSGWIQCMFVPRNIVETFHLKTRGESVTHGVASQMRARGGGTESTTWARALRNARTMSEVQGQIVEKDGCDAEEFGRTVPSRSADVVAPRACLQAVHVQFFAKCGMPRASWGARKSFGNFVLFTQYGFS
jgi:hypothetical protein